MRADEGPHAESAKRWPRVERIIERARIGIKEIDHIQCAIVERAVLNSRLGMLCFLATAPPSAAIRVRNSELSGDRFSRCHSSASRSRPSRYWRKGLPVAGRMESGSGIILEQIAAKYVKLSRIFAVMLRAVHQKPQFLRADSVDDNGCICLGNDSIAIVWFLSYLRSS